MQTIPDSYKQAGHPMMLVKRDGAAVMYKAAHSDYWEVHQVRARPPERIMGRDYPEREVLAGNEDFGSYGWACVSADRSERHYHEILVPVTTP